jgi:adenine-specific DNA-methyltransferase
MSKLELTWIGKEKQIFPEPRILIKKNDLCYGQRGTGNILIHGDNLLALKSLEQEFAGKVKCIYIDPPYNTGSAFEHYNDGLEHSIWLNLMRIRLKLLRVLLAEDGMIFVQIDN